MAIKGWRAITTKNPIKSIKLTPGSSNLHIDIPLALAIINSDRLANRKKVLRDANRTTKGSISKIMPGSFKRASLNARMISLSFDLDILLVNSIRSIKKIKLEEIIVQKRRNVKRKFEK